MVNHLVIFKIIEIFNDSVKTIFKNNS